MEFLDQEIAKLGEELAERMRPFEEDIQRIYHLLGDHSHYQDLGGNYFDERHRPNIIQRAVHRIERLGYKLTIDATQPVFS